jgi:ferric-dicitrate binding protein FerR (iron transport regulator)
VTSHFNLDIVLFERYLAGELSSTEAEYVQRLLRESPRLQEALIAMHSAVAASERPTDAAAIARRVISGQHVVRDGSVIDQQDTGAKAVVVSLPSKARTLRRWPQMESPTPRPWWTWATMICAVLIAFALGGLAVHTTRQPRIDSTTYTTSIGQLQTITLADGSQVTLAPASVLRVPAFNASHRSVELEGEAYFNVAHVQDAPFIVHTGQVSTTVLGTAFTVRHYEDDHDVRVAVKTGRVSVAAQTPRYRSVMLAAGDIGAVTDSGATLLSSDNLDTYLGWRNGQLVFRNAPTSEVLKTVGRWFGYDFKLADSTLTRGTLTAVLNTQIPSAALSTLKLLLDVDMTFQGNVVTLTPRRTHHAQAPARRHISDPTSTLTHEVGR